MNYELHIQDVDNLEDELILHYAQRDSIRVSYDGDRDGTKPLVPSRCNFTLEVNDGSDAKYEQYFTSKEKKWRVTHIISESQQVIGQWYLLPETYEEPYLNPLFYVNFEAVDGLGLLKGNTLPDPFYAEEKSVIEVIATCLKLTGIEFDIFVAPAIQSRLQENWKDIILNTDKYFDEKKLPRAYDFLYEIIYTMQCQLFQCEGRWYIEGINRRHLPEVEFYNYDINGNYKGTITITKNIKEFSHFLNATITMLPALGKVTVNYEPPVLLFSENLYKQDPKGVPANGIDGDFLPEGWNFHNFFPKIKPNDYILTLRYNGLSSYTPENYIALREKKYVLKGTRIRFQIAVRFWRNELITVGDPIQDAYDEGLFVDFLKYRIKINDRILFFNKDTNIQSPNRLELNLQGLGDTQFEFIVPENGYLDLQIIEPYVNVNVGTYYIEIKKLKIEKLGDPGEGVYAIEVDPDSSVTSEIDLPIIPDFSTNSKSFQIEKVKELNPDEAAVIEIPIKFGRQINGKNYSIVSLEGAQLIERFPNEVSWKLFFNFLSVKNILVHYNLNGSNEMAIETEGFYPNSSFFVSIRPFLAANIDRVEWLNWTDSVYKVESKPYYKVVAEIRKRMFSKPRLQIEGTVDLPLKYNDLIRFKYKGKHHFLSISDLEWSPDANESKFIMNEAFYDGAQAGDIPPYVFAGPDIIVPSQNFETQITQAVVNSPFGNIQEILWEKINGNGQLDIIDADILLPILENITGDDYTLRLTAIDTAGNQAIDEMKLYRAIEYDLSYNLFYEFYRPGGSFTSDKIEKYRVDFDPDLPENSLVTLNFTGFIEMYFVNDKGELPVPLSVGIINVLQNGFKVFSISTGFLAYTEILYKSEFSLQYMAGDVIEIEFISELANGTFAHPSFVVRLDSYQFNDDSARVINFTEGFGAVNMNHLAE